MACQGKAGLFLETKAGFQGCDRGKGSVGFSADTDLPLVSAAPPNLS